MRLHTFLLCSLLCTTIHAGGQPAAEQLQVLLEPIKSLSGKFQQNQYDQAGEHLPELAQQGDMQVTRSGKIRWVVTGDYGQQLLSDGTTLWLYDPDLEQVTIQSLSADSSATPALLLMGDFDKLNASYRIEPGTGENRFRLYPRQLDSLYQQVELGFDNGAPATITITDNLGERTEISFQQVAINPTLDDNGFVFAVPDGVDVIYN
ncbi:MAG: outer membrane lipoprotein chaperone LolA [Porticoccaceae bacterium]|nr:outer membrane lipoprotein chaperone LolA [Porticoccaceae bacterium]